MFSASTAGQHLHTTDSGGESCPAEERKHHYNSYAKIASKINTVFVNLLIWTQVAGAGTTDPSKSPQLRLTLE